MPMENLLIWDLENTEAVPKILKGHEGSVVCMAVDWASQRVASTGVDRTLRLWDMRDAAKVKVFHSESCIMCLCMDWAHVAQNTGGTSRSRSASPRIQASSLSLCLCLFMGVFSCLD